MLAGDISAVGDETVVVFAVNSKEATDAKEQIGKQKLHLHPHRHLHHHLRNHFQNRNHHLHHLHRIQNRNLHRRNQQSSHFRFREWTGTFFHSLFRC